MIGLKQRKIGLTLIEVIIALAVAAVIMQLSLNTYNRYLAKVEVNKAIQAATAMQQLVVDYYADNGFFPGNSTGAQLSTYSLTLSAGNVSKYAWANQVATCTLSDNNCITASPTTARRVVEITFSPTVSVAPSLLQNMILIMRAGLNGNAVVWYCSPYDTTPSIALSASLLPKNCQQGI